MSEGFGLRKVSSGEGYSKLCSDAEMDMEANHKFSSENCSKSGSCPKKKLLVRILMFGLALSLLRFVYIFAQEEGACGTRSFCFLYAPQELDPFQQSVQGQGLGDYIRLQLNDTLHGDALPLASVSTSKDFRQKVDSFAIFFQRLMEEGHLNTSAKALCLGSKEGHEITALKEIGVSDILSSSDGNSHSYEDNTFDFEFCNEFYSSEKNAAEIARTLKPGGVAVLRSRPNPFDQVYSNNSDSFILLFNNCRLLRLTDKGEEGFVEILLKKKERESASPKAVKCGLEEWKMAAISKAEALIEEEPQKPWITLKRNIKNIKYMPNLTDIAHKTRHIYVDVGARSYSSSIGSWFIKSYPKQGKSFDVYAIEADPAFHKDYRSRRGVNLLPYAAWVKNESLSFEINRDAGSSAGTKGMGRIQPSDGGTRIPNKSVVSVEGFDFSEWLERTVREEDFVVMKMDIEGTEFEILPRMMERGSICLVDELFLECHYNRWQRCCPERSSKYSHTYSQCLDLFRSLRSMGILVHQWW